MRRGWTKFSLCTSAAICVTLCALAAAAQSDTAAAKRANELTLAGLRPGHDSLSAALKRYKTKYVSSHDKDADNRSWQDTCTGRALTINLDPQSTIRQITVSSLVSRDGACDDRRIDALRMDDWATGHGLRLGDPQSRITELYGDPESNGPTVKDNSELEFYFYGFEWAGADVPQTLEIYCARDTGRVVEITLASPNP